VRARSAAVIVGAILACLPFLVYGTSSHRHAPHADHAPRHGGDLFMIGDYHVELVERPERVELFLSDAVRRPLRPQAGSVALDGGGRVPMQWREQRLVAALEAGMRVDRYALTLPAGELLELSAD
jgi:hypothetical protein